MDNRSFYRVMLGAKHVHAQQCYDEGWIGGGWNIAHDLTGRLPDTYRDFNRIFIPIYLEANPDKSKVAAGLACGMLHTICKSIQVGDIVLCPNGARACWVGEVTGDYFYHPDSDLPHRRPVSWRAATLSYDDMSYALRCSTGSAGTVSNITKHATEIGALIQGAARPDLVASDPAVEDPGAFALEKHLEDFLVHNWAHTPLGRDYDLYTDDGQVVAQQFPTDTGPIDILAVSKDRRTLLVVELKRGRASDTVVGQVQRYMGYVMEELAESEQVVRGAIVALEDDTRIRRALRAAQNIDFYRYEVAFRLFRV